MLNSHEVLLRETSWGYPPRSSPPTYWNGLTEKSGHNSQDALVMCWDSDIINSPTGRPTPGHIAIALLDDSGNWEIVLNQMPNHLGLSSMSGENVMFVDPDVSFQHLSRNPQTGFVVKLHDIDGFCKQAQVNLAIPTWQGFPEQNCLETNCSTAAVRSLIAGGVNIPRSVGQYPDSVRDWFRDQLNIHDPDVRNGFEEMRILFPMKED